MIPTLETETSGDVFIIRLYSFSANSPDLFREALRKFMLSGKNELVLDLRGNPGGFLEAAVDMASWFLPQGKIVVREDFGEGKEGQAYRSKGYDIFSDKLQMAVLVDEGSASASEILAAALRDHGVAKLVGAKTFGKGSVQELVRLTPETSLKITVARWLTPNGISISEAGLLPDVAADRTVEDFKAGKDPQLERALQLVRTGK
jgi:carboxyl-terminal processing protease